MNTAQVTAVVALVLLAGVILVLDQQDYIPGQADSESGRRDAFVEGMSLQVMDDNGVPVYRVTSARMTHYADTDLLELDRPVVHISRPDGSAWQLTAERGETTTSGDRVWLRGAVELRRAAGRRAGPMQITASDVLVRPVEKLAETASAATIVTQEYRIEAVGLKADLSSNRLELQSQVRGRIDVAG